MDEASPRPEQARNPYFISASASFAEAEPRVLKAGDTFAVFGHDGDATPGVGSAEGLYHRDTRYLSRLALTIAGVAPILLTSAVSNDNAMLTCDLTNPVLGADPNVIEQGQVHVRRARFLWGATCYERLTIRSFDRAPRRITLEIGFAADFADLFEVRGTKRARRGRLHSPQVDDKSGRVLLAYDGLDNRHLTTLVRFDPAPARLGPDRALYDLTLAPGTVTVIGLEFICDDGEEKPKPAAPSTTKDSDFLVAMGAARRRLRLARALSAAVESDNEVFNEAMLRAVADLAMLVTRTEQGPYPYAGIPWFSTAFGRDGIVTGLETLWLAPALSQGVLLYLAANQATTEDPAADAEPGKILHEVRHGEMALLGEVPFRRYYGSVDSTPLFVMLAGEYFDRTGDLETARALWPHIQAALQWIDRYGDADHDGFVEYGSKNPKGLTNQGWKDSHDSIFHADGTLARGPIALCEVQGYVYAARLAAARIAAALGEGARSAELAVQATALKDSFEKQFWDESLGLYVLALDGEKKPCRVRASNAGQVLLSRIASPEHAATVAKTLMESRFFSGWGIRTVASGEARYNPMSYHDGSVWPHDNALIATGFGRYGAREAALRVFDGLLAAAKEEEQRRLPELFCGFARMRHQGPTAYPVACSPQAWAAAALPAALSACLGIGFDPAHRTVTFDRPVLPAGVGRLHLKNLAIGDATIDIVLHRAEAGAIAMAVTARRGDIRAMMTS